MREDDKLAPYLSGISMGIVVSTALYFVMGDWLFGRTGFDGFWVGRFFFGAGAGLIIAAFFEIWKYFLFLPLLRWLMRRGKRSEARSVFRVEGG